jgi:hypothetical protein
MARVKVEFGENGGFAIGAVGFVVDGKEQSMGVHEVDSLLRMLPPGVTVKLSATLKELDICYDGSDDDLWGSVLRNSCRNAGSRGVNIVLNPINDGHPLRDQIISGYQMYGVTVTQGSGCAVAVVFMLLPLALLCASSFV